MQHSKSRTRFGLGYFNLRHIKRLTVGVIGGTVLVIGIALLVLPGPAIVVIPLGLAILATEFVWARRLLRKFKMAFKRSPQPRPTPAKPRE
ncbi:MAG: PGPGW domain-containing protein [Candidatus Omnitrophica bacterium]|nr:PGPGW domain-containing protein [Candidatus Omnitrophota bacterium]